MGLIGHNLPLIAWGLLGACGVVCAWALLWDRPRGRMRCRRCRYRMEGVPAKDDGSFICPECGRRHASERKLVHTNRRWRLAVICVLVGSVGWYGLSFYWRFRERGPMGYVPTTVLVLLPQAAEAWYDSVDGPVPKTPIAQEIIYRTDTIGMRVWQETMWVWNLRRHADEHAEGDWKWRWVRRVDLSDRTWFRHRCAEQNCRSPITVSGPSARRDCCGDGGWQLTVTGGYPDDLETAVWLVRRTRGAEVEVTRSWSAATSGALVVVEGSSRSWTWYSAYETYYTPSGTQQILQSGFDVLHREPGWRSDSGPSGVADVPCTLGAEDAAYLKDWWPDGEPPALYLRRFDLRPTISAIRSQNDERPPDWERYEDDDWLEWIMASTLDDVTGRNGDVQPYFCIDRAWRGSILVVSTREGLADVQRRLEDFHKRAPALWREQREEDWSDEDFEGPSDP